MNGIQLTSWEALKAGISSTIKIMAKWLVTTPAGWAVIGATAIFGLVKAYDALTVSTEEHKEQLSNLKNEYSEITSEIQSVNTELQTTKERIEELQSKGVLTFTEKKELENLIKQNNELERQNLLLEEQEKKKNKELNKKFVDTMNSDVGRGEYYDYSNTGIAKEWTWQYFAAGLSEGNYVKDVYSEQEYIELQFAKRQELLEKLNGDYTDAQKEQFQKQYDEITSYLEGKNTEFTTNMEGISYISNPSNEDEEAVNNWLDFINDFQDKLAIATTEDPTTKAELQQNTFERLVDNWQFDDTVQGLQDLGKEGKVTAEMLADPKYDEFISKLVELGVIDSADNLEDVALAFNEVADSAENAGNKSEDLKNFSEVFNAESFKDSAETLKELAISGELSPETFTTTKAYIELLKETGLTAEEAIEKIRGISVAETSLSDIMGSLQSNAKLMNEVTSEISNSGQISFDTLQNIASKYPSLERYVTDYLNGVEGAQENLVSALSRLYNNELDNYREYYVLKQQYDNGWYTNYLENTSSWVSNLASKYGIDLKNYANYLETKAALEERINSLNTTNGKIGQATSDGKFHTDDYVANTSQFTNLKQKEDLTKILNDMVKEYENSIPDPTDLLDKFKDDDYTGGLKSTKSSDTYFDHIETHLDRFNDKLDEAKEKANDTFNGWSVRDNSFGEAIDQTNKLVDEYKEARARYEEEANKSGISESDKELVQFGAIQIDKLPNDDPRKEQFESYQKWWDKIKECDEAIKNLNKDLIQLYSDSKEFRWEAFDYLEDSISRITDEANVLIDLLSNKDLFNDKGNLNEYGNATLALHASNIEVYKQQAKDYLEQMQDLRKELVNGGGEDVLNKLNEISDKHVEMIKNVEQEKQSILDLISDGYDKQYKSLQKIIDKKKESLNIEKD